MRSYTSFGNPARFLKSAIVSTLFIDVDGQPVNSRGIFFKFLTYYHYHLLSSRSDQRDINNAINSAEDAFNSWSKTLTTERSNVLLKIADRIEHWPPTIYIFINYIKN